MKQTHITCPICKCNVLENKFIVEGFQVVKCQSCEIKFVNEKFSQQELDKHYSRAYNKLKAYETGVCLNKESIENYKYYYENLKQLILEKMSTGKILDVGCSEGHFLDIMDGFECHGVERLELYGKVAKEKQIRESINQKSPLYSTLNALVGKGFVLKQRKGRFNVYKVAYKQLNNFNRQH